MQVKELGTQLPGEAGWGTWSLHLVTVGSVVPLFGFFLKQTCKPVRILNPSFRLMDRSSGLQLILRCTEHEVEERTDMR